MKLFSPARQEEWKNKKIVPPYVPEARFSFQVSPIPEKPD
jgi:hypothetical protein